MTNEIPPPPPEWSESEAWKFDSLAQQEATSFPDEEALKGAWMVGKIRAAKHAGYVVTLALWLVFLVFSACLIVWIYHYLAPKDCGWLTDDQLGRIQSVIFSGSVGALLAGIIQKFMKDAAN